MTQQTWTRGWSLPFRFQVKRQLPSRAAWVWMTSSLLISICRYGITSTIVRCCQQAQLDPLHTPCVRNGVFAQMFTISSSSVSINTYILCAGWFYILSRVPSVFAEEQHRHSMCIFARWQMLCIPPQTDTGTAIVCYDNQVQLQMTAECT